MSTLEVSIVIIPPVTLTHCLFEVTARVLETSVLQISIVVTPVIKLFRFCLKLLGSVCWRCQFTLQVTVASD